MRTAHNFIDLTGASYGRLSVVSRSENKGNLTAWNCICECGANVSVRASDLRNGTTRSCGCLHKEVVSKNFTTHGKSKTNTYRIWASMMSRCTDINAINFKHYGGRGVSVCDEWRNFDAFYRDMGERPQGKSIERLNNNKNYSNDNCIWASRYTQSHNKRNNRDITFNGVTMHLSQWAESLNMTTSTLWKRLNRGWSVERALTTAPRVVNRNGMENRK